MIKKKITRKKSKNTYGKKLLWRNKPGENV